MEILDNTDLKRIKVNLTKKTKDDKNIEQILEKEKGWNKYKSHQTDTTYYEIFVKDGKYLVLEFSKNFPFSEKSFKINGQNPRQSSFEWLNFVLEMESLRNEDFWKEGEKLVSNLDLDLDLEKSKKLSLLTSPPEDCSICFENLFFTGKCLKLKNCGHCFHEDCLKLLTKKECPSCRRPFSDHELNECKQYKAYEKDGYRKSKRRPKRRSKRRSKRKIM